MPYMLARIELKYGQHERFLEIMNHLLPVMERHGWRLHGAFRTAIGNLNEIWDLWEIDDANASQTGLAEALQDPEFAEWAARLPEAVHSEELRFLQKLPYSP